MVEMRCSDFFSENNFGMHRRVPCSRPVGTSSLRTGTKAPPLPFSCSPFLSQNKVKMWRWGTRSWIRRQCYRIPHLFRNGLIFNLLCLGLLLAKDFFFLWSNQIKFESFSLLLAALHPLTAFFSRLKTILLSNSLSSVPAHLIFLRFDKGLFVRLWN